MTSRAESGSLELFEDFRLRRARDVIQTSYHGRTKYHIANHLLASNSLAVFFISSTSISISCN